jgi:hypothetical protein
VITQDEARELTEIRDLRARVIAVDHFDAAEIPRRQQPTRTEGPYTFTPPKDSIAAE